MYKPYQLLNDTAIMCDDMKYAMQKKNMSFTEEQLIQIATARDMIADVCGANTFRDPHPADYYCHELKDINYNPPENKFYQGYKPPERNHPT